MDALGFVVVGCGNIAPVHAEAVRTARGARLVGFVGKSAARAQAMAERFGVPASTDLDAMLSRPDVGAVLIGTPSGTHAELGIRAARAGKHVLTEKPIDVTLDRGQALIDACQEHGVKLGVIFQSRFLPAVQLLKREIGRGQLGRIFMADAYVKWYREPAYYEAARWRGTLALDGGGALINQAIHTIDLLQYLVGPVASVFGHTDRMLHQGIEGEDTAVAVVQFEAGALGVIQGSTALFPGFARRIEIHGEQGSVILEGDAIREWRLRGGGGEESELGRMAQRDAPGGPVDPTKPDVAGHRSQVEDFVEAVRHDRSPAVDGPEGLKALAIVLAVYRASREGRPVAL